jgi:hypothetical protein
MQTYQQMQFTSITYYRLVCWNVPWPVILNIRQWCLLEQFCFKLYEGESINKVRSHLSQTYTVYPLCTHELSIALLHVWTCSKTPNFLIKLAVLPLTVSCQNGCVDAVPKFTLFIDSPSYKQYVLMSSSSNLNQQQYRVSTKRTLHLQNDTENRRAVLRNSPNTSR